MVSCCIKGCKSRSENSAFKFHRIPTDRLKIWGRIIKFYTPSFNPLKKGLRICGRHFVSGYPGWDRSDPDWIPSLNFPKKCKVSPSKLKLASERKARFERRAEKREEAYEVVRNDLILKSRLQVSLHFHSSYSSREISNEENINVSSTVTNVEMDVNEAAAGIDETNLISLEKLEMDMNKSAEAKSDSRNIGQKSFCNVSAITIDEGIETFDNSLEASNKTNTKDVRSVGCQTDYMDLEQENRTLQVKIKNLEKKLRSKTWTVDKIKDSDDRTKFYTGMPTFAVFMWLFSYLQPKAERMTYWKGKQGKRAPTKKRTFKLPLIDQFLGVMMRLKLGLFVKDIADRFDISAANFSEIFATWIKLMELELALLFPFPSKALVQKYMPQAFLKYPNTRIIIDCTEIFVERSKSMTTQNLTFSNYKNHNTIKFLVGITPGGVISFVSKGWGGRVSDKVITRDSNLMLLLEESDNVMADKGFLIEDLLKEKNCGLNLPPFLKDRAQFSEKEILDTRRVAELRINVERAIGRVKTFHIFDGTMPITMAKLTSSMFAVCCYLTNIYEPLS